MSYKLSTLEITPKAKASTTSEIFVADPDKNKEALAGKLFVIIEIESTDITALKIINFLTENIANNYYQDEKIALRESNKAIKVEHIFEAAIGKTNKDFINFIHNEKNNFNLGLINATIGVIYDSDLCFVNTGKNKAKLIFKKNDESKEYTSINIAGHIDSTREQNLKNKLFTSVINGSVPANGYIVFANETLPEYVSDKQMIDIITTLPPQSATEQIKNTISGVNNYVSFLGLIIKNTLGEKESIAEITTPKMTVEKSVSNLNNIEEKTEKLLSTGGNINLKKTIGSIKNIILSPIFSKSKEDKKESMGAIQNKSSFVTKRKFNFSIFKKIISFIQAIILFPVYILSSLFNIIRYKEKRENFFRNIKTKTIGKIKNTKNWFIFLDKRNKVLFIIVIICILLLGSNLSWLYLKNKNIAIGTSYAELVKKIEQKQNQVEANLLYNNEEGAKKILVEIDELLAQLPTEEGNENKYIAFYDKHNEQLDKIRHAIKLNNPLELVNFTSISADAKPDNIILLNNKIYAGDSAQKTVYSFDLTSISPTIHNTAKTTKQLLSPSALKNDDIYYLNDKIVKLDTKTGKTSQLSMAVDVKTDDIVAMAPFNNNFYLLDKNNGQIWRLNKTTDSLSSPTAWLSTKADLVNAADLDIDGNIYVLKKDGVVVKYFKGESKDLNMEIADPLLEQASKIIISQELDFMYILDPTNNRVVVYTKTGDFVTQYHANELSDIKDFAIDETNNIIYFLNNTSLYKANLEHLGAQE